MLETKTQAEWLRMPTLREDTLVNTRSGIEYAVEIIFEDENYCIMKRVDTNTLIECKINRSIN